MKRTVWQWLGLALLTFTLAACSAVEEAPASVETQDFEGGLLVFPETIELEAAVGETAEASFYYLNVFDRDVTVRATTFASWITFTAGNVETVPPFGFVEVKLRATCDERLLELVSNVDDELFSFVRVQGFVDLDLVGVTLKCS